MKSNINPYEKILAEGRTSLRPEDIKAYGVQRFLNEQKSAGLFVIPNLHFTKEENRLMNQLLAEERLPIDESEVHED